MATNVGAMGYFMYSNDPTIGLACLGTTTALSSIMGVTLTAAIGGICCFSPKHAALRRKSKDWLNRNQNNVSE